MPQGTGNANNKGGNDVQSVVNFDEARAQKLDEKRRKTERIFFKNILGVYTVTGASNLRPVEIIEVSEEGCSFQVPVDPNKPWPTDANDIPLRLYFSQDTYLPITVKVENARPYIEHGVRYMRYGCSIDKSVSSFEAYIQFVKFLKLYSEHSHKDMGDVSVFYL